MNEKGQEKGITLRLRLYERYCNRFRDFLSRPEEAYRSRSSKVFRQKGNFVSLFPGPSPVIRLAVCLPAAANQIFSS